MDGLRMFVVVAWITVLALAPAGQAQDKKPAGQPIDAATKAAYEKLGGHYSGVEGEYPSGNRTMVSWTQTCEVGELDVPRFQFYVWGPGETSKPWPAVAVPFGLDFSNSRLVDAGLKWLDQLENLRSLSLWKTQVTDAGLKELGKCKNLAWLDLSETRVTGVGFKELAGLKHLTTLYLDKKQLNDANLRLLREHGLLHAVAAENAKYRNQFSSDDAIPPPRPKSNDEVIAFSLGWTSVTDEGLKELGDFHNLEALDLRATTVTPAGLKGLACFKKLSSVKVQVKDRQDVRLKELQSVKSLPLQIFFSETVTDADLRRLRELDLLYALSLMQAKGNGRPRQSAEVHALDLRHTFVGDAGLKELADLKNLAVLHLQGQHITDAALRNLVSLNHLVSLRLDYTKVTAAGVAELQKALPGCSIDRKAPISGFYPYP